MPLLGIELSPDQVRTGQKFGKALFGAQGEYITNIKLFSAVLPILVTIGGCGDAIGIGADVKVYCEQATFQTDVWGAWLKMQLPGTKVFRKITLPASLGVWQQFLAVRAGKLANPSPPELGLRLAQLWDALKVSAEQGGRPVAV